MKILKDVGKFEVLRCSNDVIGEIAEAARTCYQSQDKASPENDLKLVKNLLTRGHHAMLEFPSITVRFSNISIGMSRELMRHRLASYAEKSTRYVDELGFEFVVPPHRDENELIKDENVVDVDVRWSMYGVFKVIENVYKLLRKFGWKPEDTRQAIPLANSTEVVMKVNLRELLHIFTMRCDKFAHWEIRAVMLKLLKWCQANIPVIFDHFKFFTTADGIEYARPVQSAFVLSEKINEYNQHFDLKDVVNKLDDVASMKLYQILK